MDAINKSIDSSTAAFHSAMEGKIDFEGQRQVQQIIHVSLVAVTVASFIAGFATQSLQVTFGTFGTSTLLLALVVVPPWPVYNKHPVQWLPPVTVSVKTG